MQVKVQTVKAGKDRQIIFLKKKFIINIKNIYKVCQIEKDLVAKTD